MLQRLGVRGKILATVAVPILVLLLAAGYITLSAMTSLTRAENAQQLVATARVTKPFQTALNTERAAGAHYVDTFSTYNARRVAAQGIIDNAVAALRTTDRATYNKVEEIFTVSRSMTLSSVRALGPIQEGKEDMEPSDEGYNEDNGNFYVWPSNQDTTIAVGALQTMAAEIEDLAKKERGETADYLDEIAGALEAEATATQNFFTVPQTYQQAFVDALTDSDNNWVALRARLNEVAVTEGNASVNESADAIRAAMESLENTRTLVRTVGNSANTIAGWYNGTLTSVNDFIDRAAVATADPDLSIQLSAYGSMFNLVQSLSTESILTQRIIRNGEFPQGGATAVRNYIAASDFALDEAQKATTALNSDVIAPEWGASTGSGNIDFESVRNTVSQGDQSALATIANVNYIGFVGMEIEAQQLPYDQTIDLATARADNLRQGAFLQTIFTAVAAAAAVAARCSSRSSSPVESWSRCVA